MGNCQFAKNASAAHTTLNGILLGIWTLDRASRTDGTKKIQDLHLQVPTHNRTTSGILESGLQREVIDDNNKETGQ